MCPTSLRTNPGGNQTSTTLRCKLKNSLEQALINTTNCQPHSHPYNTLGAMINEIKICMFFSYFLVKSAQLYCITSTKIKSCKM